METKDLCHYFDAKIIPVYLVPCKKNKNKLCGRRAESDEPLFSLSKTFKTIGDFFSTLLPDFLNIFSQPIIYFRTHYMLIGKEKKQFNFAV